MPGVVTTQLGLTEVAAQVFELRLPIPFEDGLVNVFLFTDGDDVDLLDCGMNTDESVAAIRTAVRQVGANRIRRLVVTHRNNSPPVAHWSRTVAPSS